MGKDILEADPKEPAIYPNISVKMPEVEFEEYENMPTKAIEETTEEDLERVVAKAVDFDRNTLHTL